MSTRETTYTTDGLLITVRSSKATPKGDALETDHHAFLVDHWPSLAAAAYQGFKQFGIGAIVIQEHPQDESEAQSAFATYRVWFASSLMDWLGDAVQDKPAQWLDDQLQQYDPNRSGLFIFVDEEGSARPYQAEGTPAPPEAFAAARARYN